MRDLWMVDYEALRKRVECALWAPHLIVYLSLVIIGFLVTESLGLSIFVGFLYMYVQRKYKRPIANDDTLLCVKLVHYTLLGVLLLVTPLLWLMTLVMLIVALVLVLFTKKGKSRWNIWKY